MTSSSTECLAGLVKGVNGLYMRQENGQLNSGEGKRCGNREASIRIHTSLSKCSRKSLCLVDISAFLKRQTTFWLPVCFHVYRAFSKMDLLQKERFV